MRINLVENGLSKYNILIKNGCSAAVQNAAEQLKLYAKSASGCDWNIVSNVKVGEPFIALGDNYKAKEYKAELDKSTLKYDGFIIKCVDANVFIVSKTDLGVLYGVYEFLDRVFGVKFLTKDYTHIPFHNNVWINDDFYLNESPAIEHRAFLAYEVMETPEFASHMRMNHEFLNMPDCFGGVFGLHNASGHNMFKLVPLEYYDEHPEWFFTENGKVWDICYSHVGLNADGTIDESLEISPIKLAVENFLQCIIAPENKKYQYFMIGQRDTFCVSKKCMCDECQWQEQYYGRGGLMVRFVNAIDTAVRKRLKEMGIKREFNVVTFAYLWSQDAPYDFVDKKPLHPSVVPNKNVYIRLAPIESKNFWGLFEAGQTYWTREMFLTWPKLTKKLMAWTYTVDYGGYFIYYPTTRHWSDDLLYMSKKKFKYVMFQAAHNEGNVWQDKINTYIASKMMWDPTRNAKDVQNEFIDCYYGEVSGYIKQFIENFDCRYATFLKEETALDIHVSTRIGVGALLNSSFYTVEFWEEQMRLLVEAKNKILSSDIKDEEKNRISRSIDQIMLIPQYMVGMRYDAYYPNNVQQKEKFLKEFFDNCKSLKVEKCTEGLAPEKLAERLGINIQ